MNCSKEYEIKFKKIKDNKLLEKIQFVYSGVATCYQCNYKIPFDGSSHTKERTFKCPKCGLEFSYNIDKQNRYRTIASIQEIEVKSDNGLEKSKEGGTQMETEKNKVEEKVTEVKEEKKEEVKSTPEAKTSEVKESPKAGEEVEKTEAVKEEKVKKEETSTPEEPKVEEKTEAKPAEEILVEKTEDVIPADIEYESQFEKQNDYEITLSKVIVFAKLDDKIEDLETAKKKDENAKRLTYQERKAMPDNMFAVVVTVKNKRTGRIRKIRKYPINDKAHVRNALARLAQPKAKATLRELGVSIESVRRKIMTRARKLGMKSLIERHRAKSESYKAKVETLKASVRKVVKRLIEANKKIELYKANAKEIIKRQTELGETKLTDEEILNDDKFALAKAQKENALLKASANKGDEIVGAGVERDDDWYAEKRKEIDKRAELA
jgi:hypothetical protein